jgi:NitT/TauT family transport system substrate-binding protein
MPVPRAECWTRRAFLHGSTLAGTVGLLGLRTRGVAAEPPLETTRLRLTKVPSTCRAPQWVAEALLLAEGFTEVQYVKVELGGKGDRHLRARAGAGRAIPHR